MRKPFILNRHNLNYLGFNELHIQLKRISTLFLCVALFALMLLLSGSPHQIVTMAEASVNAPISKYGIRYEPLPFTSLKGWASDDHRSAYISFLRSCAPLLKKNKNNSPFNAPCRQAMELGADISSEQARAFFETKFLPFKMVTRQPSLLTGYYEPILEGARKKSKRFAYPLYRRPADLVTLVADTARGSRNNQLSAGRKTANGIAPYATREEIDKGALNGRGLELVYLEDPIEVFFLHIQGSGQIRLRDGRIIRVGYDGKNGHLYSSIGKALIKSGKIPKKDMALDNMRRWLKADLGRAMPVLWVNKSYIFFRELEQKPEQQKAAFAAHAPVGPLGAANVPLTPGRSVAIDPEYHPFGTPLWLDVRGLQDESGKDWRRLMIAQDVGSAIRGARRADLFWGSGEQAGLLAGRTAHRGAFYVLWPQNAAKSGRAADQHNAKPDYVQDVDAPILR